MMTAKEYVEGKVKSYTRLAERCRREAEASDDIVVRAGYSARANVWEMCARRLGYASANSFAASVCHWLKDGRQHVKYICQRELIPRSEVDSLPQRRKRKKKQPASVFQHGQTTR